MTSLTASLFLSNGEEYEQFHRSFQNPFERSYGSRCSEDKFTYSAKEHLFNGTPEFNTYLNATNEIIEEDIFANGKDAEANGRLLSFTIPEQDEIIDDSNQFFLPSPVISRRKTFVKEEPVDNYGAEPAQNQPVTSQSSYLEFLPITKVESDCQGSGQKLEEIQCAPLASAAFTSSEYAQPDPLHDVECELEDIRNLKSLVESAQSKMKRDNEILMCRLSMVNFLRNAQTFNGTNF